MVGTTQGAGQLGVHLIAFQINLVVTRMRGLVLVTEPGAIITRSDSPHHGQYGYMQQVPMSLSGVREAINHRILILIARTTTKLGDGAELHHCIGQGSARISFRTPCARLYFAYIPQVLRLPQSGRAQERIDIFGQFLLRAATARQSHQGEQQE